MISAMTDLRCELGAKEATPECRKWQDEEELDSLRSTSVGKTRRYWKYWKSGPRRVDGL